MEIMEKQKKWIRIAGHSPNIKENKPLGWRCYIEGNSKEILLKHWFIVNGNPNKENFIPGFNSEREKHGLLAWIDCFGSYEIKEDCLYISLDTPINPILE